MLSINKIKIQTKNGNLALAIHYPRKNSDKLAILCPGYLDSKDYEHLVALARTLVNEGYTVVRLDPIGTWESDDDISKYTTTQYLEDIKNTLEYMLKQFPFKTALLGGHSRGGQLSLLYASRDPRISIVLGIMPSQGRPLEGEDREKWKRQGVRNSFRDLPENKDEKREFRVPFSHVLDKDQYITINEVNKIKCPMILIAGELDDMCTPAEVKEIFDNANELKKFIVLPSIGHDYRHNEKEIKFVNEKIVEQLKSLADIVEETKTDLNKGL